MPALLWLRFCGGGIVAVLCLVAPRQQALAGTTTNTTEVVGGIREQYKLPALAVVVIKGGGICDRAAVGVRKKGDPTLVTTNDQFHIGSCTKSMTATVAATLIEEGKLRWDTTIASVFPELKGKMDKQYETVTVEQLLTHRGGVPGNPPWLAWLKANAAEGSPTQQRYEFIQAVLRKRPEAAPGTKFIYSNQGYAIAGAMMEKLTGTPWETLMTNRLFKPLHMDSAGFGPPGTTAKTDQPWGHRRFLGMTSPSQDDNPAAIGPAGIVHCSLDDLARYAIFHLHGEREDRLLKKETVRKLHTSAGDDYACGWVCAENPKLGRVLWHNGSNTMWYVLMWLAPEKDFAVLVGTNFFSDDAEQAALDLVRAMIKKWAGN
jgi:CubicO group peptidase (beta-lactamase class C family)